MNLSDEDDYCHIVLFEFLMIYWVQLRPKGGDNSGKARENGASNFLGLRRTFGVCAYLELPFSQILWHSMNLS